MPTDSLKALVLALLAQLPEENNAVVIVVKPETSVLSTSDGQRPTAKGIVYEPSVVYVLELATILALRDGEAMAACGKDVAEALQSIMRDAKNVHATVVARALFYLLNLLRASYVGVEL